MAQIFSSLSTQDAKGNGNAALRSKRGGTGAQYRQRAPFALCTRCCSLRPIEQHRATIKNKDTSFTCTHKTRYTGTDQWLVQPLICARG